MALFARARLPNISHVTVDEQPSPVLRVGETRVFMPGIFCVDKGWVFLVFRALVAPASRAAESQLGGVPEWLKGTGCKPVGVRLRWFESNPLHQTARNMAAGWKGGMRV